MSLPTADVARERTLERFKLCQKSLKKAKFDLMFWTKERLSVIEELSLNKQFNFDELFKEGV